METIKNELRHKPNLHKKILSKLFLLALPIIISTPIIPFLIIYLPTKISHIFTSIIAIYTGLILLTLCISLVFSPDVKTRLISLPINFVMGLFGFVIFKLRIYRLILNAFSLGKPFVLTSEMIENTTDILLPLSVIGIWISILPILIYSLRFVFKLQKKKDITNAIKGKAYIKSVVDTHTRINKNKVYTIELDINSENGKQFIAKKDFIIPTHILHTITLGNVVDVLIDPNNSKEVYIQTAYGVL